MKRNENNIFLAAIPHKETSPFDVNNL
jgi:hypothetical protein